MGATVNQHQCHWGPCSNPPVALAAPGTLPNLTDTWAYCAEHLKVPSREHTAGQLVNHHGLIHEMIIQWFP